MLFGTPLQGYEGSSFIYDTGSGYLTTTTTACSYTSGCSTTYYDQELSSTAATVQPQTERTLVYGSAELRGFDGTDVVCLSSDADQSLCATDFQFFLITYAHGLNGVDGILGMSPSDPANGPSLMQALYDQGKIPDAVATFVINDPEQQSSVTLGGVPDGAIDGKTTTLDLLQDQDSWWTLELDDMAYGSSSIKASQTQYAILDTGTSFLTISRTDYESFSAAVVAVGGFDCAGAYCYSQEHYCDRYQDDLEDLTLTLQGKNFTLRSYQYLVSGDGHVAPKCLVAVSYLSDYEGLYILGDTFLRSYVSTFNYTSEQVLLGASATAPTRLKPHRTWEFWVLVGIVSACGLVLLIVLVRCMVRRVKAGRQQQYQQVEQSHPFHQQS